MNKPDVLWTAVGIAMASDIFRVRINDLNPPGEICEHTFGREEVVQGREGKGREGKGREGKGKEGRGKSREGYTPEPHIITRRDIPSIAFQVTDKDHHEVDFNGEEIVLELEFITYDIVSIPLHQPSQEDKYAAPHNFAPDYARRQFPQPIQGGSHLPSGFSNYR